MQDKVRIEVKDVGKYRKAIVLTYASDDLSKIGNFFQALLMLFKGKAEVINKGEAL